jgi:CHAD domain-containing protein
VSTDREVESKFEAADDVRVDHLDDVPGVARVADPLAHHLDAVYFDTGDLRLLRAGIGLRRRTGGDDAGWHLKIEESLGERLEVRRPLGRSTHRVPKALRELITVQVRNGDLAPVARVQTARIVHRLADATGEVIATVADDHVQAETPTGDTSTWRELEVELAVDDRDLLAAVGDHLVAHGAAPSPQRSKLSRVLGDVIPPEPEAPFAAGTAGAVVTEYLRDQVDALIGVDPAVRLDVEDAVHKMRVATRRLRSALATYRRLLDRDVTEPLRDELKWLGGVLGAARDAEVIRDHLLTTVDAQPAPLVIGPVRRRIATTLGGDHRRAHDQLRHELASTRYVDLVDQLDHVGDSVGGRRARRRARRQLPKAVRRAHRRMRRALDEALAGDEPSDVQLHELRKAVKRVRYAAESVADVCGSDASSLAAEMEQAQETLGEHQDTVVIRDVLRRCASDAAADGDDTFTYGRLHALEETRAAQAEAAFLAAVDDGWGRRPSWLE